MKIILYFLFISISLCNGQSPYPQNYFTSPLDITLVVSGTFAELRSNHFHSGLDLKTKGTEGLSLRTAAAGYVSRIKISRYGYGKALYITHPNGYTTVYAHLQKFSPSIEAAPWLGDRVVRSENEKSKYLYVTGVSSKSN